MSTQDRTTQDSAILEGRYRVVSEGTPHDLGVTFKAYDLRVDRPVEVLILAAHFGGGTELLNRIVQANQAVADLQQPALVPFEHVGLVHGRLYLVRSQAVGRPLAELLSRLGALKVDVAIELAVRLCEVLAPLHRAGLVHGGLSPYSVFVRMDDQDAGAPHGPGPERRLSQTITVVDAGLLPALRPLPPPPDQPWGRFPYISPEQAAGEDVHPASDVYVIGSLLYEMLAGRPPFRSADKTVLVLQHLRQDPPSLQILVPQVPLPLSQIVQKALAKEPSARYRNAGQLAHILRSQLAPRLAEPTAPRPSQAVGHLVVPPPPAPYEVRTTSPAQATRQAYGPVTEEDEWVEEAEGPDWLLIGLLILAFIAVLGLIPLWRTVYRRYTAPPPALESSHVELDVQSLELDDFGLVWYNSTWLRSAAAKIVPDLALQPGWKNISLAVMDVSRVAVWHGS